MAQICSCNCLPSSSPVTGRLSASIDDNSNAPGLSERVIHAWARPSHWSKEWLNRGLLALAPSGQLLFRGLLLPRMGGVFGRWDWLANGLLFAAYHLHIPWAIPSVLLDTLIISYPARRLRSAVIGICVHSVQTVVLTGLLLALVLT